MPAKKVLPVPYIGQKYDGSCGFADASMVLSYLGFPVKENELLRYSKRPEELKGVDVKNRGLRLDQLKNILEVYITDKKLPLTATHIQNGKSQHKVTWEPKFTNQDAVRTLDSELPFVCSRMNHAYTAVGYDLSQNRFRYIVHNPSSGDNSLANSGPFQLYWDRTANANNYAPFEGVVILKGDDEIAR